MGAHGCSQYIEAVCAKLTWKGIQMSGTFISLTDWCINLHTEIDLEMHCAVFIYALDVNMQSDKTDNILLSMSVLELQTTITRTMFYDNRSLFLPDEGAMSQGKYR